MKEILETTKTEKIKCAEQIIDYANRRTVEEMINEPGLYEAIRTTNLYLKRYVNNLKTEAAILEDAKLEKEWQEDQAIERAFEAREMKEVHNRHN